MFKRTKRRADVMILAFALASSLAACTTTDEGAATDQPAPQLGAPDPLPTAAGYTYALPYYDRYGYNEYGYHQYGWRGARCVRQTEWGTCAGWLTG